MEQNESLGATIPAEAQVEINRYAGRAEPLDLHGLPLGVDHVHRYAESELALEPGDLVFAYTDGLIEARRAGEVYGHERLCASWSAARPPTHAPAELVRPVHDEIADWAGGLTDDAVALALRRQTLTWPRRPLEWPRWPKGPTRAPAWTSALRRAPWARWWRCWPASAPGRPSRAALALGPLRERAAPRRASAASRCRATASASKVIVAEQLRPLRHGRHRLLGDERQRRDLRRRRADRAARLHRGRGGRPGDARADRRGPAARAPSRPASRSRAASWRCCPS